MVDAGSSVPRRQMGRLLRKAREEAGIALEAAARELEWSRARMYRIEGGQVSLRTHDVALMCQLYRTSPDDTEVMMNLARESKAKGWWQAYGDAVPAWFHLFAGLEQAASRIRFYSAELVPGILQTRACAEAIFWLKPNTTEEEVARKTAMRLDRGKLLERRNPKPPTIEIILDEAVLRRPIRDLDAWREQLAYLSNVIRPGLSFRVLPSALGPHPALTTGNFVVFEFPQAGPREPEPTTVYSEHLTGALYQDKPSEVVQFEEIWEVIDEMALDLRATQDLITEIIKETYDD